VASELPLPAHFDPSRIDEVWRVAYEERAREAVAWAAEHGIEPAAEDDFRLCLVIVDAQNTFCTPGFELYVPGAPADNRRLCEFVYRNLGCITQIVPTLDTHHTVQVFHAAWLIDEHGRHPDPMTIVSAAEVESGHWRVDPAAVRSLGLDEEYAQRHLLHYTRELEEQGKYHLTIWPYHAMLGGIGYALVSAVEEAVFFHGIARAAQADFQIKGAESLTEHYSVLGPEVATGPDGEPLGTRNAPLIDKLRAFDAVVIAGQAKSHCVAWTIDDLLTELPDLAHKVYLLEDCSSPVRVPGVVDYTAEADAAFDRFAAAGMHVVRSTMPVAEWPDFARYSTSSTRSFGR
jgi:nicotinamidase-related amidase